ncbi:MAG: hypothetical protein IT462_04015 [Planctomycetes bacterium]|nr:hypothetical protein [Planctomycetota bacterium]
MSDYPHPNRNFPAPPRRGDFRKPLKRLALSWLIHFLAYGGVALLIGFVLQPTGAFGSPFPMLWVFLAVAFSDCVQPLSEVMSWRRGCIIPALADSYGMPLGVAKATVATDRKPCIDCCKLYYVVGGRMKTITALGIPAGMQVRPGDIVWIIEPVWWGTPRIVSGVNLDGTAVPQPTAEDRKWLLDAIAEAQHAAPTPAPANKTVTAS